MSSNASPGAHKHPRILACVLCQHRKIKCDRNSPCSNCIKANVTCTPSTPAPARKRRRPNQDLQERLARCEELLKQYASGSVPIPGPAPAPSAPPAQRPLPPLPATPSNSNLPTSEAVVATPASVDSTQSRNPGSLMVKEDGNVRFMDSYIWASVYDELQKMRDIVETDDPEESSLLGSDELTPDNNADLVLSADVFNTNVEDLQPDPIHVFRLWQLYCDRVNPLFKILHIPSLQPLIIEAASNMAAVPLHNQALLFSVFAMATVSMSAAECIQTIGMSRDVAIQKFNTGTKASLIKYSFLKNYNMTTLQAVVLYLLSLEGRYDRHAQWVISGVIMRIAQKMGYHRDGSQLNLIPFETEMRRRIWWQIMMLDAKCAMMSGLSQSWSNLGWDTKKPLNLNDADLFPGSTEPVVERDGPTEMAFSIVISEIFRFKLETDGSNESRAFEAAMMGQTLDDGPESENNTKAIFEKFRKKAEALEERLLEIEKNMIDIRAGNVHVAALAIRPMLTRRLKEMLVPIQEQPEWGTEIFGPKDNFFKVLLMMMEHKTEAHEQMVAAGFQWFMRFHFQLDAFAVFTGLLHDRPVGSLSDRAWEVMRRIYGDHHEFSDMTIKPHVAQAQFVLKAWRARELAYGQNGQRIETPSFINRLRELVPSSDSRSSGQGSVTSPATTVTPQQQPLGGFNQFLGGYLDVSTVNWEMFGEFLPSSGEQLSASMFDGYTMGNLNMGNMG
ncbi:fungal specific transcription factor domain-containing protein [Trichoderma breve]|uniref:Fungal specific transcription factor domain-containing protein n=1 Tax=Trichoderma breve TaxID=2034170 RepID=A0A9W9JQD3_9HYPO|nr:fungal specific transcription factor domain-containing protein [Trichoderma breve]KAJ4864013.1 fungal specific transcription factor domain-containing protein [Trichoderma breve]